MISEADVEAIKAVLTTLSEVVQEAGEDFIYTPRPAYSDSSNACVYVWNGQPDCIAARVMVKLGLPIDFLEKIEGQSCWQAFGSSRLNHQFAHHGLPKVFKSDKAGSVLRQAQIQQDEGRTWGTALEMAIESAHFYGVDFDPR